MGITVTTEGKFTHTEIFLKRITRRKYYEKLDSFAQKATDALAKATPKDTGKTAASWDYEIKTGSKSTSITWTNDNVVEGYYYGSQQYTPIVVLLIYGHGTESGYYVPGNDFVTPAIEPYLDKMVDEVWSEVTKK